MQCIYNRCAVRRYRKYHQEARVLARKKKKKEKLPSHFIQSLFKKLAKRGIWACVDHLEPVEEVELITLFWTEN